MHDDRRVTAKHDHPEDGAIVYVEHHHDRSGKAFVTTVEVANTWSHGVTRSFRIFGDNDHRTLDHREHVSRFSQKRFDEYVERMQDRVAEAIEEARTKASPEAKAGV